MSNASNFADRNVDALGETLREGAEHVKRTAEELISESADAVGEMADAIRSDETVRKVRKTVRRMATESRSYFERNDVDEIASDVVEAVRRHPGTALLALAAVGYLMSRALRRIR